MMALQHFREFLCGSMQESFLGFHIECSFHQRRSQTTCYFRPKLSKDQHLSMDLNECRNFPHCSNSNFKFSKHTHLPSGDNIFGLKEIFALKEKRGVFGDKWWQIFSILWVPWINGGLSKPLPIPREIYFPQEYSWLNSFRDPAGNKVTKVLQNFFGLQT